VVLDRHNTIQVIDGVMVEPAKPRGKSEKAKKRRKKENTFVQIDSKPKFETYVRTPRMLFATSV